MTPEFKAKVISALNERGYDTENKALIRVLDRVMELTIGGDDDVRTASRVVKVISMNLHDQRQWGAPKLDKLDPAMIDNLIWIAREGMIEIEKREHVSPYMTETEVVGRFFPIIAGFMVEAADSR